MRRFIFLLLLLVTTVAVLAAREPAQYVPAFGIVGSHVAGPTLTYVGGCTASGGATTISCTSSPSSTSGNLLIAISKTQNNSGTGTPAFFTPGGFCTWGLLIPPTDLASGIDFNATVYGCVLTDDGTAATTVSWTGTTGGPFTDISISEWHSTDPWNDPVFDRSSVFGNTTASTACPTGTTGLPTQNPYDLVLAICENFNSGQTWGTYTGWTNQAGSSTNTVGLYSKPVASTGTQSASIPLSASDTSVGMLVALQASNNINCANCAYVQSDNSAGSSAPSDFISLAGVVPGDTLVYYVFHSNWSGTGMTTFTDSTGTNIWYPCNADTGGGVSTVMTDIQLNSTYGMSCFYSVAVATGGVVTGQAVSSDCASNCTYVGGTFMEFSGIGGWDGFSSNTSTSTTSPNNLNCGSLTTSQPNDLILCGVYSASGTPTAGTVPISFSLFNSVNGSLEWAIWPSSGTTSATQSIASTGVSYGAMAVAFK